MYIKTEFILALNNNDFEPGFGRPKPAEWNEPLPLSLPNIQNLWMSLGVVYICNDFDSIKVELWPLCSNHRDLALMRCPVIYDIEM